MRLLPLLSVLVVSCGAPDRWSVTGARSWGEIDGVKSGLDTEEDTLEVGISGPLFPSKEPRPAPLMPWWKEAPPPPAAAVSESEESDMDPLLMALLMAGGAAASEGTRYGSRKVKERRARGEAR